MQVLVLVVLEAVVLLVAPRAAAPLDAPADFWVRSGQERLQQALRHRANVHRAKNIILFIGDGMGVSTVTAARILQGQRRGGLGEEHVLSFEAFPSLGLAKTYCHDMQVADSASTATAMLSGVKVNIFTLGLGPEATFNACDPLLDPGRRLPNIARWAQQAGKWAGLVTTTRVTHATPAALYAHTNNRDWECDGEVPEEYRGCVKDIALQLVENDVAKQFRVVMGGGWRQMGVAGGPEAGDGEGCARSDGRNLVAEWLADKPAALYVNTTEALLAADPALTDHLLGLFGAGHVPYVAERGPQHPSLVNMTTQAIRVLSKAERGFFLMVEGGRIDHGHHRNLARMALGETCELDEAVAAALALVDLSDTLVVVTADHSHTLTVNGYPARGNDILGFAHSPGEPPLETLTYANGPGFLFHRANSSGAGDGTWRAVTPQERLSPRYPHLAAIYAKDESHGGEDVAVFSTGPWAHLLTGVFEQNFIAHAAAYAAHIGPFAHPDPPTEECAHAAPAPAPAPGFLPLLVLSVYLQAC